VSEIIHEAAKRFNTPPASRTRRFFKLAGMTASVATEYASNRIRSKLSSEGDAQAAQHKSYQKMAVDVAETLGELKGAVMKLGQIASQTQDFLPKEFSEALQKLQKEAPPMDYSIIRRQVITELGAPPEQVFGQFDREPYAAASIGQVHKAVTRQGRPVIVKVQYPGIDRSLNSDLQQLRLTLRLGGLLKLPKASVDQMFREIHKRLGEELDYGNEAGNLAKFREFHKDTPAILIPEVVPELSTKKLLTLEFVEGDHISQVTPERYSQQIINSIGQRLFRTLADQLFKFNVIHGDPHPGNFAFRPDGTIIMYDFGCVKKLKPEIVHAYKQAIIAGLNKDYATLDHWLIDMGVRNDALPCVDKAFYAMWRELFMQPFEHANQPYHFSEADLHKQVATKFATVFPYIQYFKPPVETIFIDRMIAGHYWTLKRLKVQGAFRSELERYLGVSLPQMA